MALKVRTSTAWLPSSRRATPRRPCEAITIKSQSLALAVARMPSAGKSLTCTVSQAIAKVCASACTLDRISFARSAATFSYSSIGKLKAKALPSVMAIQGSVAVTATTCAFNALASASPVLTALAANSEPSVAIRMRLYMAPLSRATMPLCCTTLKFLVALLLDRGQPALFVVRLAVGGGNAFDLRCKGIAHATHGFDQRGAIGVLFDLLAQPGDQIVDGPIEGGPVL